MLMLMRCRSAAETPVLVCRSCQAAALQEPNALYIILSVSASAIAFAFASVFAFAASFALCCCLCTLPTVSYALVAAGLPPQEVPITIARGIPYSCFSCSKAAGNLDLLHARPENVH